MYMPNGVIRTSGRRCFSSNFFWLMPNSPLSPSLPMTTSRAWTWADRYAPFFLSSLAIPISSVAF